MDSLAEPPFDTVMTVVAESAPVLTLPKSKMLTGLFRVRTGVICAETEPPMIKVVIRETTSRRTLKLLRRAFGVIRVFTYSIPFKVKSLVSIQS
jgi:hypothetical protein